MTTFTRALVVAELVTLRALLPRWFARDSLDGLLARLDVKRWRRSQADIGQLERDVARTEALIERATRLPSTCLYRALSRYAVLNRTGHAARFCLGLPRSNDGGAGHAWVEVSGVPFAELEDVAKYRITFSYPRSRGDERVTPS